MQLINIFEGLMPTFISDASAPSQELTKSIAQYSDTLNLQNGVKTMKSGIEKLISVQKIQVDPCGSGWENIIQRQQSHIYISF